VWGKLSPAFRTCETGADQSPIDLRNPSPGEGDTLRFDYAPSPLTLAHDGHTIRMDYAAGSALENGRGRYELTQLHFHAPSEHTVDGKAFPMELHLVHKDPEGHLAVVGVLFQLGQRNSAVAAVFDNMPARPGKVRVPGLLLDATALLPRKGGYFSYPGSLTTPPCDEGVRWHVLKARMTISKEQLASFRKVFGSNARPVQPLRDRVLREM
jgi:carbonic anhydrase